MREIRNTSLIAHPSSLIPLNGWLILDKPLGMSSAQAVARVKWLLRNSGQVAEDGGQVTTTSCPLPTAHSHAVSKIGHAGTLDPLATGVLTIALGEATKAVSLMMDATKTYEFEVTWGEERDTDDGEGKIIKKSDKRPSVTEIEAILSQFEGEINQAPPNYSAIKQQGKRAYAMARAGEVVEMKERVVRVDQLVVSGECLVASEEPLLTTNHQPLATTTLRVVCGKGTYVRSLARDMGRVLGCFGYVSSLRRTKVGNFNESDAISLETLEEIVHKGELGFLKPIERVLDDILALSLSVSDAKKLRQGQLVPYSGAMQNNESIAVLCEGKLVALCELSNHQLKPKRVFNH